MMNQEFNVGVIKPVECMKEGWELIKDQYWLFFGITFVGMLIGGFIPFGIGVGAMFCGIYYTMMQKLEGKPFEFGDLFKGFNYFLQGLIPMLIIVIPAIILSLVMYGSTIAILFSSMDGSGKFDDSFIWKLYGTILVEGVVLSLVMGCLHALIMFSFPLIIDKNLSGLDAFKLSSRAVWQNLSGVVGLILVEFVLGLIGYMICGIGLYLTMPIMFAGVLVAYRRVFPKADLGFNAPPPNAFNL
ncbi:MAG: hypothetical protein AAB336_01635 [Acidobacteriota bacterium]